MRDRLQELLLDGVKNEVFPGACACVAVREGGRWLLISEAGGILAPGHAHVTPDTIYDVASLTKPIVATTALYAAERLAPESRVEAVLPEAAGTSVGARTWEQVLSHRAGLPAWHALYDLGVGSAAPKKQKAAAALAFIVEAADDNQVGTVLYSDLGYILFGLALERSGHNALVDLVSVQAMRATKNILRDAHVRDAPEPVMGYAATLDTEQPGWRERSAPTGDSPFRPGVSLQAEVHDDNAAWLGGVAAHAGVFANALCVAAFGAASLDALAGRGRLWSSEPLKAALAPRPGGTHRVGWDGRSTEQSSAGSRMSQRAFGHLGFTGTSLWCDPERDIAVALLSNRVHRSIEHIAIRAFRPAFHDAVLDAYDA